MKELALALAFAVTCVTWAAAQTTRLNPNTATPAQLAALPQMTPALVQATVAGRPYETIGEFNTLVRRTLDAEQAEALYASLFVPINLNTASSADIGLIPGMTRRMTHEFEEYRPYTSMDQFNREIGKYVPEAEVARLRSYVTLE
jgi:DNA uptake protein ComE-like DNA-binding protein